MANISIRSTFTALKRPIIQAGGFIGGAVVDKKVVSKIFDNNTVKGFLGSETSDTLRKYASPAIIAFGSAILRDNLQDDVARDVASGMMVYGCAQLLNKLIRKSDIVAGFLGVGDGLLGSEAEDIERALQATANEVKALDFKGSEYIEGEDDDDLEGEEDELEGEEDELEGEFGAIEDADFVEIL